MKTFLYLAGVGFGIVILSIVVGGLWWRMWMYHGWLGSPHWLSEILALDGEGSYKATMLEMMVISFAAISSIIVVARYISRIKMGK